MEIIKNKLYVFIGMYLLFFVSYTHQSSGSQGGGFLQNFFLGVVGFQTNVANDGYSSVFFFFFLQLNSPQQRFSRQRFSADLFRGGGFKQMLLMTDCGVFFSWKLHSPKQGFSRQRLSAEFFFANDGCSIVVYLVNRKKNRERRFIFVH